MALWSWFMPDDVSQAIAQLIDGGPNRTPILDGSVSTSPASRSDGEIVRPPAFSDIAIADRFAEKHHVRLRYVAVWGRWFEWCSGCWRPDATLNVRNLLKLVCQEVASECGQP